MWRIYYEDGLTWDYSQGAADAPSYGVICVLQAVRTFEHECRYHIVYGCPYYVFNGTEWLHAHDNDLVDFLVEKKPIDKLLIGRMTTKHQFGKIYNTAKVDKDNETFK